MVHRCKKRDWCCCSSQALEPSEECPIHGGGDWPPRCGECGRFMKYPVDYWLENGFECDGINCPTRAHDHKVLI